MSPSRACSLVVRRTARWRELGDEGGDLRELWYVLHGYGQLAAEFIEEFDGLAEPGRRIIAPEGLSRFYPAGGSGPVGASWMTSEDREEEIADYVGFLDALHAEVSAEISDGARVTLLGFSQGAATAARWVGLGGLRPQRLILWAGGFPPDLDPGEFGASRPGLDLRFVVGERDTWITAEDREAERARLGAAGLPFHLDTFAGGHRLDAETLRELAQG